MDLSENTTDIVAQQTNIPNLAGKELPTSATVFFDPNCSFCRSLAQFMSKLSAQTYLRYAPSEDPEPKELVVMYQNRAGEHWVSGLSAWQWLLDNDPALAPLSWLAEKLFIHRPVAKTLSTGASLLRKICGGCR
jgi:hypothetical protein